MYGIIEIVRPMDVMETPISVTGESPKIVLPLYKARRWLFDSVAFAPSEEDKNDIKPMDEKRNQLRNFFSERDKSGELKNLQDLIGFLSHADGVILLRETVNLTNFRIFVNGNSNEEPVPIVLPEEDRVNFKKGLSKRLNPVLKKLPVPDEAEKIEKAKETAYIDSNQAGINRHTNGLGPEEEVDFITGKPVPENNDRQKMIHRLIRSVGSRISKLLKPAEVSEKTMTKAVDMQTGKVESSKSPMESDNGDQTHIHYTQKLHDEIPDMTLLALKAMGLVPFENQDEIQEIIYSGRTVAETVDRERVGI
ncbi:hypothetical protein A3D05_04385 [Candidatus Gottesmanbacteria bacterium RIFCSPHIGHO2_02_FULL_40_24]|nr:MAG: hypothetical protein A3D05_04385 [Candidatus Gottesmanbacteria bacterium RIFCSPHIGHO2_02_FULL_40_24]